MADVDVTLGPLTVLVGRNGAGKSAFVDALSFVHDALNFSVETAIQKRNGVTLAYARSSAEGETDVHFEVSILLDTFTANYGFTINCHNSENLIRCEYLRVQMQNQSEQTLFEIKDGQMKVAPPIGPVSAVIPLGTPEQSVGNGQNAPTVSYFSFDASKLVLTIVAAVVPQAKQVLQFITNSFFYAPFAINTLRLPQSYFHDFALFKEGSNLASLLNYMQIKGVLPIVKAALSSAINDVEDLRIYNAGSHLVIKLKHRDPDDTEDGLWFDLAEESDGTVHLLVVLAALYQSLRPGASQFALIAIEEPETALYPAVLSVLADVIKEASNRAQLIITTQSPDLISEFNVDTLRIVEKRGGATHIGPVEEVQRSIINDHLFTTGDLLRIEGLRSLPAEPVSASNA